jgi:hypothetical protein
MHFLSFIPPSVIPPSPLSFRRVPCHFDLYPPLAGQGEIFFTPCHFHHSLSFRRAAEKSFFHILFSFPALLQFQLNLFFLNLTAWTAISTNSRQANLSIIHGYFLKFFTISINPFSLSRKLCFEINLSSI